MNQSDLKDNLLVTIGSRAAYMDVMGHISLPSGSDGEDELALFASRLADSYMKGNHELSFDEYIETALKAHFPKDDHQFIPRSKPATRSKTRSNAR